MEMYIPGIGQVSYSIAEYVAGPVVNTYMSNMNTIKTILEKGVAGPTDYDDFFNAIANLKKLVTQGAKDSAGITYYVSQEMAQNLNIVLKFLQSASIPLEPDPNLSGNIYVAKFTAITNYINNWSTIKPFGGDNAINGALNVYIDTRSLQSMIELEYVKQGNELIYNNLNGLSDLLQTLQSSLDQLQLIQTISNNIVVLGRTSTNFKFPPDTMGDIPSAARQALLGFVGIGTNYTVNGKSLTLDYYADWMRAGGAVFQINASNNLKLFGAASAYDRFHLITGSSQFAPPPASIFNKQTLFASAIKRYISGGGNEANNLARFEEIYKIAASAQFSQLFPTPKGTQADATSLIAAKNALINIIASIERQTPGVTRTTVNTLPYFLNRVVNDISAAFVGATDQVAAVNKWILDGQDKRLSTDQAAVTTAGSIQGNITQAIRTAQNLNDTKKEEVNQYMFIFQEFYKSSSSILQKVSQMVERMAQTISR